VFDDLGSKMKAAFAAYDAEVKNGTFPAKEHTYAIDDSVIEKLY
jgi:3-methyl-2-oxobutanoate hydroxymethyltransferase